MPQLFSMSSSGSHPQPKDDVRDRATDHPGHLATSITWFIKSDLQTCTGRSRKATRTDETTALSVSNAHGARNGNGELEICPPCNRRAMLVAGLAFVSVVQGWCLPRPAFADNTAVTSSLSRYIKKKKLDIIDTYIPPLLNARAQLIRVGRVMCE